MWLQIEFSVTLAAGHQGGICRLPFTLACASCNFYRQWDEEGMILAPALVPCIGKDNDGDLDNASAKSLMSRQEGVGMVESPVLDSAGNCQVMHTCQQGF